MAFISNCAEGGTDGTTPTSGNSGGLSGTALDSQTIGSGCTLTFAYAAAYAGALGYRYTLPSGNVSDWQRLPGLNAAGRVVLRFWFRLDSVPTQTEYLCSLRSASAQVCVMSIGTDGKLVMQNAAGAGITSGANGSSASSRATNAISANTWYRVEISATKGTTTSNGSLEYAYYLGDSTTAEFSWTGTTNVNAGTANITSARLGRITSAAASEARTIDIDGAYMVELASGWYGADPVATPAGIASAEAFGSAVVSSSLTVAPTGIASAEAFGTATVSSSLTVSPAGIASAEAFGTAALSTSLTVAPSGASSGEAFGTPTISTVLAVAPSGIASEEAFGSASVSSLLDVAPTGIPSGESFGTAEVTVSGGGTIQPLGIPSEEAFGTPAIGGLLTVAPSGIESGEAFGIAALGGLLTVAPAGIPSGEAFGTAVLTSTERHTVDVAGSLSLRQWAGSLASRKVSGSLAPRKWEGGLS